MTNRRDFLNLMGLGIAGGSLLSAPLSALAQRTEVDLVVFNARVRTVDPGKSKDIKIVRTVVGGKTVYQA